MFHIANMCYKNNHELLTILHELLLFLIFVVLHYLINAVFIESSIARLVKRLNEQNLNYHNNLIC